MARSAWMVGMCCAATLPALLGGARVRVTRAPEPASAASDEGGGWGISLPNRPTIPDIYYSCEEQTEFGPLDRWVTVTPDVPKSTKMQQWMSPSAWYQWAEEALSVADEDKPPLPFQPFGLRKRQQYNGNILAKIVSVTDDQFCHGTFEMVCEKGKLQVVKQNTCAGTQANNDTEPAVPSTSREVWHLSKFRNGIKQCSETTEASYFRAAKKVTVSVGMDSLEELQDGQCVSISTLNPSSGIDLGKLDADLMGSGVDKLIDDATKLDRLVTTIGKEVENIGNGLVKTAESIAEGGQDVMTVIGELQTDLRSGGSSAGDKSVKWIKRLTLDSEVDTCLCCDQPAIHTSDYMAKHCLVAYTLGGESQNRTVKHSLKTIAGTMYNLAQTAGGWLVPFLGANIVRESHKKACQYMCDLRKPHIYEQFEHGKIRKVPGLAMQTWFIPNPKSFFGTATGATEAVVETAGTGAATNVLSEVVDVAS